MSRSRNIDGLLARGLDRYRAGDIDGALALWEQALVIDPGDARALGYVDFVRQNYDELVGGSGARMSELLIPFGLARSDDDEYEISITESGDPSELTTEHRRVVAERLPDASVDDGWGLDAEDDPTWLVPSPRRKGRGSLFDDENTGDLTIERGALKTRASTVRDLDKVHRRVAAEDLTTDGWPQAPDLDLSDPRTPTADMSFDMSDVGGMMLGGAGAPVVEPVIEPLPPPPEFEERGTADLKVRREKEDRRSVAIEDLLLPPPASSTAHVDDDSRDERLPRGRALTADEETSTRLSEEIDEGAPLIENPEERARRRIQGFLARAKAAAVAGDHATAVASIDLALSEAPDIAAAQKLVHRSRDLILDCYYRFFGDLDRMPVLAAPLAELTRRPLDPRAAFLLSRIDGTITFEEILDVAGMGRLEACRHLAHLLWRGIIRAP